ncbi:hypothetical protein N1851_033650 [Merluccius polli]|uniref:Uncharacterized protein n=1 Tax=Merluccius polli TaxID=89951 RepID=A0AA47M0Z9_MERPO|nr:hypothetical protein N1851_033650 [Merluccius polli]
MKNTHRGLSLLKIFIQLQATSIRILFVELYKKHNKITVVLVQQQLSATLPDRDLTVFNGDALQTFEHCIERTSSYQAASIIYSSTPGGSQESWCEVAYMTTEHGYRKAKTLLKENFGNEYRIATAYIDKAFIWPI